MQNLDAGDDNSTTVCEGAKVDLSTLVSVGGGSFSDPGATGKLSGSMFDTEGLIAGDYTINYTVASGNTCPDDVAVLTITVDAEPDAGANNSASDCPGTIFDLTTLVSVGGGSFSDPNATGGLSGSDFNTTGLAAGDYTINYTVASGNTCPDDVAVITITVENCDIDCENIVCEEQGEIIATECMPNGSVIIQNVTAPFITGVPLEIVWIVSTDGEACPLSELIPVNVGLVYDQFIANGGFGVADPSIPGTSWSFVTDGDNDPLSLTVDNISGTKCYMRCSRPVDCDRFICEAGPVTLSEDYCNAGCPDNIIETVDQGVSGAYVSWEEPTFSSTCPWGGVISGQAEGPASGSFFATGTTTMIRYWAYDGCGFLGDCIFYVTVMEGAPCPNTPDGTPCDDGDDCTENDQYTNCNCAGTVIDSDFDGVCDVDDNCPEVYNPNQEDVDNDNVGDACDAVCNTEGQPCDDYDPCTMNDVLDANCNCAGTLIDIDSDGICDLDDNCPNVYNPNQEDADNDNIGDVCDPCNVALGSPCDDGNACTVGETYDADCNCTGGVVIDSDSDGVCDADDNCPDDYNPNQEDGNNNGIGDACESAGDFCPTDIVMYVSPGQAGTNVTWPDPTWASTCPWGSVVSGLAEGAPSGSFFATGTTTTIRYWAFDGCGFLGNCIFTVTVSQAVVLQDGGLDLSMEANLEAANEDMTTTTAFRLYPNPAKEQLQVDFEAINAERIMIRIVNMQGAEVLRLPYETVQGMNKEIFDISKLSPGVYYLQIQGKEYLQVERFIRAE